MGVILRRRVLFAREEIRARGYKVVEQISYQKAMYRIERVTKYKRDEKDITKRVRYGVLRDGDPLRGWYATRREAIEAAERNARHLDFSLRNTQTDHRSEIDVEWGLEVNQAIRKARRKKARVA